MAKDPEPNLQVISDVFGKQGWFFGSDARIVLIKRNDETQTTISLLHDVQDFKVIKNDLRPIGRMFGIVGALAVHAVGRGVNEFALTLKDGRSVTIKAYRDVFELMKKKYNERDRAPEPIRTP